MKIFRLLTTLVILFFTSTTNAGPPQGYTFVDMGTIFNDSSFPFSINNNTQVVGISYSGQQFHSVPFIWEDDQMTELPTFGGTVSESGAGKILDSGVIAGWSSTDQFHQPPYDSFQIARAFVMLNPDGELMNLGSLSEEGDSIARSVNNKLQVVGWSHTVLNSANIIYRAWLWEDGVMNDLGTLGGGVSAAIDINDSKQIVGDASTASGQQHAFLWQDGIMRDLDPFAATQSRAKAINNAGQIAGVYRDSAKVPFRSFFYNDGEIIDIGTLGSIFNESNDINEQGDIVGVSSTADGLKHGYLWSEGEMYDLNVLTPGLPNGFSARAINDKGEITGKAYVNGNFHAYLLTPIGATADINGDGNVNTQDLLLLFAQWGQCPKADPCPADLDNSGSVNTNDLLILFSQWT